MINIPLLLTDKRTISFLNGVLFLITAGVIVDAFWLLSNVGNNPRPLENLMDGIATIFVAYGVALEERDTLMKLFKLYPKHQNHSQEETDKVCHFYGLIYLLIGLFMEVAIEVVKLPYKVFGTVLAEEIVFGIGICFCFAAEYLLLKNMYLLAKIKHAR